MYKKSRKAQYIGAGIAGIVSVLILVFAGWLLFNRQYVADVATVWLYTPSPAIQTVNERVDFSDKGQFYFHATQPKIADASQFNEDCPRQEPNSPILGCYANGRIFIYDIENEQLDGIEEVTAAHEMLHAVWERHSEEEKSRLTRLLQEAYSVNTNPELTERMEYYERSEPGEFVNELHSILPTEVSDIGTELQTYYDQYFDDRQKIVALHQKYSAVFNGLVDRANVLYDELVTLSDAIERQSAQYDADVARLSRDIDSFNARAQNGDFSSMSQFNQERSALIARSQALEALRVAISNQIDGYNARYEEYERIASEIDTLNKSIDSISELPQTPTIE